MAGLHVLYRGDMLGQVTVSVGIAGFPANGNNAEQITRTADGALFALSVKGATG